MICSSLDPGQGFDKRQIYDVWGDLVDGAAQAAPQVVQQMYAFFQESGLIEYFNGQLIPARQDGHQFLSLEWGDLAAHIDARPFGEHLDVYAILVMRSGLLDHPDPLARLASLEGWQRRDLQVFQTLIKHAMEEALGAVDEGRLFYSSDK